MSKQIISNYVFNSAAKTVTLSDFTTIRLDRLQLITDVTTNTILYNFADSTVSTASVATNVITLSTVGSAASADKLSIIYDALSGDPVYDGYKELASLSAGSLNADLVPSTDVSGYKWLSLHITGTYSGTITFQISNDGTNWVSTILTNNAAGTTQASLGSITTATGVIFNGPVSSRYFRARMTAYTSGTATGTAEFYTVPGAANAMTVTNPSGTNIGVVATQTGTWTVGSNSATGSAVPANAFMIGGSIGGTLKELSATNTGDAISMGNMITSAAGVMLYNGTNYDRSRSAVGAPTGTAAVAQLANTNGGATPYKLISAATTNATSVKASAGNVYSITAMNTNAAARYLKLYDKASSAVVGTDVPVQTILLPGNTTGAGVAIALSVPISFSNGISFAVTGAMPDTDTTAIAANDCVINLAYK